MELFKELSKLLTADGEVSIVIKKKSDDKIIVMTCTDVKGLEDPAKGHIPPLILTGTPAELDNGFLEAIITPVSHALGLQSNMKEFEEGLKKAESERKKADSDKKAANDAKTAKVKKTLTDAQAAFDKKDWKKAIELFEQGQKESEENNVSYLFNSTYKKNLETAKKKLQAAGPQLSFGDFDEDENEESSEQAPDTSTEETNEETGSDSDETEEESKTDIDETAEDLEEESPEETNEEIEEDDFNF